MNTNQEFVLIQVELYGKNKYEIKDSKPVDVMNKSDIKDSKPIDVMNNSKISGMQFENFSITFNFN